MWLLRTTEWIWGHVVFQKDYQDAVERYMNAARPTTSDPDPAAFGDEEDKECVVEGAGKNIKAYLKDLWSAFILVVRTEHRCTNSSISIMDASQHCQLHMCILCIAIGLAWPGLSWPSCLQ
jgi:hypothetical protein